VFENRDATRAPNADIRIIFLSLAFCRRQKVESQISFSFAYVVFAQILVIIHIYAYMKVTGPRVHYRVITLWVSISSCCCMSSTQKFETYILTIYKHNFDEYYSCEHNMHKK
jgi:hypothetical protein